MTRIRRAWWLVLLALTALWWVSDRTLPWQLPHVFAWRAMLLQYGGVLAIGVMSIAMVLATRPVAFEPWLGGLDKMYRLHKWLGISALALSVAHWLIALGPGWLVGWQLLQRPARSGRPPVPDDPIRQFLAGQHGLAERIGEIAFYAAVVLMVLALMRRFPYRHFFRTHRLLALAYLALVWHSVVLMRPGYWTEPLGPAMALLLGAGTLAALRVLTRRVAAGRKAAGEVAGVVLHPELDVVELQIRLVGRWAGHSAGQFAFVTLHEDEGPHPYTITSPWTGDGRIEFIVKALGDYTRTLAGRIRVGDGVEIEGPYGRFDFSGDRPRQVWIGAGIGITPFVARMKALALEPDGKSIDLFHPTAVYDPHAIGLLERDAHAAGVRLHVLWDERDGRLDAGRIRDTVPDWRNADVWFCGPAGFGRALQRDMAAMGLPERRFHQELFEMR